MGPESLTVAVSHRTTLRYSETIGLSYNEVRMRPRDRGNQRVLAFALLSAPAAVPRSRVDFYGNFVHRVDVTTPHDILELSVEAVVENGDVRRRRPAQWQPDQLERDAHLEFALPSPRVPLAGATRTLLQEWAGDDRTFDALAGVSARITAEFRYVSGATHVDSSIDDLLAGGAGVCQDFTHLFLALARHAGWPARYVSGYLGPVGDETTAVGETHAWAEVCGPDGRWVGLDPTQGDHTGPQHIRLAVGRDYGDVAPHRGLFYGTAGGDAPEVSVRVSRMSPQQAAVVHRGNAIQWQQQQQQQQQGLIR
jgi:transglutaminase-like putative cysteine protease